MSEPPLGLILAGGLARRMGGGDKARITIGGRTILDRVIATMKPQCSALIINANGDPARFADTRLPVVADSVPDFAGPLAGILAGLDWAAAHGGHWVVLTGCRKGAVPRALLHEGPASVRGPPSPATCARGHAARRGSSCLRAASHGGSV